MTSFWENIFMPIINGIFNVTSDNILFRIPNLMSRDTQNFPMAKIFMLTILLS